MISLPFIAIIISREKKLVRFCEISKLKLLQSALNMHNSPKLIWLGWVKRLYIKDI
jgi:hypothetical protein